MLSSIDLHKNLESKINSLFDVIGAQICNDAYAEHHQIHNNKFH